MTKRTKVRFGRTDFRPARSSRSPTVTERSGFSSVAASCEVREFDRNFLAHYNKDRLSVPENGRQPTVVLSHWYRSALGGFDTTASDNRTGRVKLGIKPMRLWGWRSLRAACHHPDIVVRLGTRLGVLGICLGVLGVCPPIAQFLEIPDVWTRWLLVGGTVATLAAIYACKGPSRPPVPLANPRAQYSNPIGRSPRARPPASLPSAIERVAVKKLARCSRSRTTIASSAMPTSQHKAQQLSGFRMPRGPSWPR